MTTLEIIGLVALGVVVVVLVAVVVSKLVLYLMKGPLEARIATHYGPDPHEGSGGEQFRAGVQGSLAGPR